MLGYGRATTGMLWNPLATAVMTADGVSAPVVFSHAGGLRVEARLHGDDLLFLKTQRSVLLCTPFPFR